MRCAALRRWAVCECASVCSRGDWLEGGTRLCYGGGGGLVLVCDQVLKAWGGSIGEGVGLVSAIVVVLLSSYYSTLYL